ncbi:MAG TPA: acyltransferase family protein [Polyangiales bacterium]
MTSATKIAYRADVDGLRAVAVLAVLLFHAFPEQVPGGFVGVDVFFVISGSLITGIIVPDIERATFRFGAFYGRRVRRLFPSLLVVLIAHLMAGAWFASSREFMALGKHTTVAALSIANLKFWQEAGYFDGASELKPLLHTWSLGVEEQFYLIWPAALVSCRRLGLNLKRVLGAIVLISFAGNVWLAYRDWASAFFLPMPRLWELGLGGLLALERGRLSDEFGPPWIREASALLAFLLLVACSFILNESVPFPGWWALLPTLCTAYLLGFGAKTWLARRVLGTRPAVFVGLISYPLYLWHWPLLAWGRTLSLDGLNPIMTTLLVVVAVPLAWLTYRYIEQPLRFAPGQRITASLATAMTVLAVIGACGFARVVPIRHAGETAHFESELHRDTAIRAQYRMYGCDEAGVGVPEALTPYCSVLQGTATARETVVLWGDSFAGAWAPLFAELSKRRDRRFILLTHNGCPPVMGVRRTDGEPTPCRSFKLAETELEFLRALAPTAIVLAARWGLYANGDRVNGRLQRFTHFLTSAEEGDATLDTSREALRTQLPTTVAAVAGIATTIVVKAVPGVRRDTDGSAIRFPRSFEWKRAEVLLRESLPNRVLDDVARSVPRVRVFDPMRLLCGERSCGAYVSGQLAYSDDCHVTAQAALHFQHEVEPLLAGQIDPDAH